MNIKSIALLALAVSGNAWAHEEGHTHWWLELELDPSWYAGAGLAQNSFEGLKPFNDGSFTSSSTDDTDTGMRLFAGVGFGRYLALELGYTDFGEGSFRAQSDGSSGTWNAGPVAANVEAEGIDLALLGKLPLSDAWGLFGKVGYVSWDRVFAFAGDTQCCGPFDFELDDSERDVAYGAGVHYEGFGPLRLVAEYGVLELSSEFFEVEVDSFGISLAYLF